MDVLLTDGSHKNTLAIIRYLGKVGHKVDILHHKKSAPAYSIYCHRLIICPPINKGAAYFDFVLQLLEKRHYDILIPVGVKAIEIFSRHLTVLRKFVNIEICDYSTIKIALEKKLTFQYAEKNAINHPKTIYPNTIEEALLLSEKLQYPMIIKSSNESITKFPTIYIQNKDQLTDALKFIQKSESEAMQRSFPLIQERIYGKGYGFFAIYQHGVCKKVFMHERIRENPVTGGVSTCARSFYDPDLLEIGKKVLDGLHWHGQVMVEFKKDEKDGKYKLIEINPKFWGSLELCLSSGMNFPLFLCEMSKGKDLSYSEEYNRNRIFLWIVAVNGELYRLFQKPSDTFIVLLDWLRLRSRSDVWLKDFKPTVVQFFYFLSFVKDRILKLFKR